MTQHADATLSLFARTVADACERLWWDTGQPPESVHLVFCKAGPGYLPQARPFRTAVSASFETRLGHAASTCLAMADDHPNAVVFSDNAADGGAVVHTVLHDGRALYMMTQTLHPEGCGEPRLAFLELRGGAVA